MTSDTKSTNSDDRTRGKFFWILIILIILVFGVFIFIPVIFVVIYLFVVQPYRVVGEAMLPTYPDNAFVLTEKFSYQFEDPERGDVVVFQTPDDAEVYLIKRIVGLPGEIVTIHEGEVLINNTVLNESYIDSTVDTRGGSFLKEGENMIIPDNNYFLLGDNRYQSLDSRIFGFVPIENITGKVVLCYANCSP